VNCTTFRLLDALHPECNLYRSPRAPLALYLLPHETPPKRAGHDPKPIVRLAHLGEEQVVSVRQTRLVPPDLAYDRVLPCAEDALGVGVGQAPVARYQHWRGLQVWFVGSRVRS
jgi:hypothetical protein